MEKEANRSAGNFNATWELTILEVDMECAVQKKGGELTFAAYFSVSGTVSPLFHLIVH